MSRSRPKVFIYQRFDDSNLPNLSELYRECEIIENKSRVHATQEDLMRLIPGVNGIFIDTHLNIDETVLKTAGSQLEVIGTISVGYNHIDLDACKRLGVKVGYTPGVLTNTVAEMAITLLLSTAHNIKEGMHTVVSGKWTTGMRYDWKNLEGSTVGIVGLGRIGFAVAKRLLAFDIKRLVYFSRNPAPGANAIDAEYVDFETLLNSSDFIVICCAYTPETHELFNKKAFSSMRNDAILINISRGGVVNQDDLLEALTSGQIGAAGLDVTTPEPLPEDHALLKLNNCLITPHIGSLTKKTISKMADLTASNIMAALKHKPMPVRLI